MVHHLARGCVLCRLFFGESRGYERQSRLDCSHCFDAHSGRLVVSKSHIGSYAASNTGKNCFGRSHRVTWDVEQNGEKHHLCQFC